jgi:hypothetical protein
MTVMTFSCAALALNQQTGLELGRMHIKGLRAFEDDLRGGVPAPVLANRYTTSEIPIYTSRIIRHLPTLQEEFPQLLRMARKYDRGVWKNLYDPPMTVKPVDFKQPLAVHDLSWDPPGTATCTGKDPSLLFALPKSEWVYAIRIRYSMDGPPPPAEFQAYWRKGDTQPFREAERTWSAKLPVDPEQMLLIDRTAKANSSVGTQWTIPTPAGLTSEFEVIVPVDAEIDQFRIDPNNQPCIFTIRGMEILTRPDDAEKRG